MNTVITSREKLLEASRSIAAAQGLCALNMRAVAAAANVAVGSVYNYFPAKSDLVCATVEDIWRDIFHSAGSCSHFTSFLDCVRWLFDSIQSGAAAYPDFLQSHMSAFEGSDRQQARQKMQAAFLHIQQNLQQVLCNDSAVRPDAFDETFTAQAFVEFVLQNVVLCLCQPQPDCSTLLAVIRRILY